MADRDFNVTIQRVAGMDLHWQAACTCGYTGDPTPFPHKAANAALEHERWAV